MLIFKVEATWALANVASGTHEQTKLIIDMGFIPLLKDLISMREESIVMDVKYFFIYNSVFLLLEI